MGSKSMFNYRLPNLVVACLSVCHMAQAQLLATSDFESVQGFNKAPIAGQGSPQWFEGSALNTIRIDEGGRNGGQAAVISTAQYLDPVFAWVDIRNKSISSQSKILVATAFVMFSDDSRPPSVAGMDLFESTGGRRVLGIRTFPSINTQDRVGIYLGNELIEVNSTPPPFWAWTRVRLYVDLELAKGWVELGERAIGRDNPYSLPTYFVPNFTRIADADLFVDPLGYNDIYFDDYKVEAIAPGAVTGSVTLERWTRPVSGTPISVEIRNATGTVVETKNTTLNSEGRFTITTSFRGSGFVTVKASHWLRRSTGVKAVTRYGVLDEDFLLINGDCDGDNEVTVFDYIEISNAFMTTPEDPGWNVNADLDGDGEVTVFDYIILSNNFGLQGD